LHSYGFMDSAFPWLIAFGASQLAFMMIGLLPPPLWRSRLETSRPSPPLTPDKNLALTRS
jgi:hypothetical protein